MNKLAPGRLPGRFLFLPSRVVGCAEVGFEYQLRGDGVDALAVLFLAFAVGAEDAVRLDAGAALVAQKDLRRAGLNKQRGEGAGCAPAYSAYALSAGAWHARPL